MTARKINYFNSFQFKDTLWLAILLEGVNNRAVLLLLVKCYDKKWFMSPYNWVIYPLTQPQVANQQKKKNYKTCLNANNQRSYSSFKKIKNLNF